MTYAKLLKFLQSLPPERLQEEAVVVVEVGSRVTPGHIDNMTRSGKNFQHLGFGPEQPVLYVKGNE